MSGISEVARSGISRPGPTGADSPTTTAKLRRHGRGWPVTPYLFLAVPLVFLIVLTYVPVANQVMYSFTSWDGISKTKHNVGFDNYVTVFTRPDVFRVFFVSLYYIGGAVLQMLLALYFATILSFNTRFRNFFKGMIFFPFLINGVAIALIFVYFLRPGGTLDEILKTLGAGGLIHQWTGDQSIINFSLAGVSIWRYMGLNFVLFLGAIQSIPAQLYEAAEIDGANKFHVFRYIIAPSIRPIISLSFILAISGSLAVYEIPFIMVGGANGSETFVIKTVKLAFQNQKVGLASAMATVLLIIVLIVTWIQRKIVPDEKVDLT